MAGFFFQIMGLRATRERLARKRRFNRRVRRSLEALQTAAAEIEGLRSTRERLARKRMFNRRVRRSLEALQTAAAEIEGLRATTERLARKRRFNMRVRRSLEALQTAAAEIEVRNWRIMEEIDLIFVANTLTDQWVHDRLVELEIDPLMRNAFERRNTTNVNQAQPFLDGAAAAAGDHRE